MMRDIIQSERQKPRALELYQAIYAAHIVDPKCGLGERCPMMVELKAKITALEDAGVKPTISWNSEVD
jgi:hypothetical protein